MIVLSQTVNITKSIVGTVIVRIDSYALFKPVNGIGHIVFIVVSNAQSIMRVIIVRTHLDASFIPFD